MSSRECTSTNVFAIGSLRGDSEYRMEEGVVLLNNTGMRTSELGPDRQKDSRYGLSLAVLHGKGRQLRTCSNRSQPYDIGESRTVCWPIRCLSPRHRLTQEVRPVKGCTPPPPIMAQSAGDEISSLITYVFLGRTS